MREWCTQTISEMKMKKIPRMEKKKRIKWDAIMLILKHIELKFVANKIGEFVDSMQEFCDRV